MCKLSEIEIKKVLDGDNAPIGRLYDENYDDLMNGVRGKTKSKYSYQDMEDAIHEAFFVIIRRIKQSDFRNDNICGFIVEVAFNKLRDISKKMKPITGIDVDEIERYFYYKYGNNQDLPPSFNLDDAERRKIDAKDKAWENLGGACKRLLEKNWVEGRKLKDIWQELGYASYDVAKTTKSRCIKKLKKMVNDLLNG